MTKRLGGYTSDETRVSLAGDTITPIKYAPFCADRRIRKLTVGTRFDDNEDANTGPRHGEISEWDLYVFNMSGVVMDAEN